MTETVGKSCLNMAMGCGALYMYIEEDYDASSRTKKNLYIFNGLSFIGALLILALGIWFLADPDLIGRLYISVYVDKLIRGAGISMIIAATLVFIFSFVLGCYSAYAETYTLLCIFTVLMSAIMTFVALPIILVIINWVEIEHHLWTHMGQQAVNVVRPIIPYSSDDFDVTMAWSTLQHDLNCCGANNYLDYQKNTNFNATYPMPKSCCKLQNNDIDNPLPLDWDVCMEEFMNGTTPEHAVQLHTDGCCDILKDWLNRKTGLLVACNFSMFVILVLTIIYSFRFCAEVAKRRVGNAVDNIDDDKNEVH